MTWYQEWLWAFIRLLGFRHWFAGGAEYPTDDDWRNPFWRWTESRAITISMSTCLRDFRVGYKKAGSGKWVFWHNKDHYVWVRGRHANFYNGIFTYHRTETSGIDKDHHWVLRHRFNIVIRLVHPWWFAFGVGTLPDRGEFGWTGPWFFSFEAQSKHNPGVIAGDHEEGAV